MKSNLKGDIYAGSVVIVQSHDPNSLIHHAVLARIFFDPIGDTNQTVQIEGYSSDATQEISTLYLRTLFGAWIESGYEDKELDELYRSRLIPSSPISG
jgi:hypothetical protein